MELSREQVKILLETARTAKEADEVINKNFDFTSIVEKVAFLKGIFDISIIGCEECRNRTRKTLNIVFLVRHN